jgi:hypothetical protein
LRLAHRKHRTVELLIYHGVYDTPKGYVYLACAALLILETLKKEIAPLTPPGCFFSKKNAIAEK